ncbi:MAG: hypothetical protein JWM78_1541 [Verrucomicrobiaceae bacterium]|nr:hypothetical protein [Verrucomicrobiaceae bacterium]
MLAMRIWHAVMAILTFAVISPYFFQIEKMMARLQLAPVGPLGEGNVLIASALQGISVGLYCLWGAIDARRAEEALRFLVLYMACICVGRAMAATPYLPDLTSTPVIVFSIDFAITIFSAALLYRYQRSLAKTI